MDGRKERELSAEMIDGGTERELSATIAQLVQRLKGSHLHSQLERRAKDCLHQPEIKLESLKEDVRHFLRVSGWEKKLHNAVYREMHVQPPLSLLPTPPEHRKEPLLYMRSAQVSLSPPIPVNTPAWEKALFLKSLSSMELQSWASLGSGKAACRRAEGTGQQVKRDEYGRARVLRARVPGWRPGVCAFMEEVLYMLDCGRGRPGVRNHRARFERAGDLAVTVDGFHDRSSEHEASSFRCSQTAEPRRRRRARASWCRQHNAARARRSFGALFQLSYNHGAGGWSPAVTTLTVYPGPQPTIN
ncbi:unnamed protein product [Arctogadus glacialis]